MTLTLVLGGARSGKSAVAEQLAADSGSGSGSEVVYVATGVATDPDMAARIAAHRDRRPASWRTVESDDLLATLAELGDEVVLVDSLGTWLARVHDFAVDAPALAAALRSRTAPTVVVSEEVGLGVHPETSVGRAWRDAVGEANRAVAGVADAVLLVVAGRVLPLPAARPAEPPG